jgi:hypothetical protein
VRADIGAAAGVSGLEVIEAQPARYGDEPSPQVVDAVDVGPHEAGVGLLHHVFGVAHAAQHAVRDVEDPLAVLAPGLVEVVAVGHRFQDERSGRFVTWGSSVTRDGPRSSWSASSLGIAAHADGWPCRPRPAVLPRGASTVADETCGDR